VTYDGKKTVAQNHASNTKRGQTMRRTQFSPEEVLGYVESLSRIGERAAGTEEELEAARLIENEFEAIGLVKVHLESFPVVCRKYGACQLQMLEPTLNKVPCTNAGTSPSTPDEGISADLIDGGFGTARDYQMLTDRGVHLAGKIALIERSDRLTWWPDLACRLAADLGIVAVIFASNFSEHTAFRKEAFPFAPVPAVSIPYREAQALRDMLRRHKVKVALKNIVEIEQNGVSYNVIGDLKGCKFPKELVIVSAHHDSWFEGANDDAIGVALMLEAAKGLKEEYKPKRTIRFVSFGAEESGSKDFFEWAVGSYNYVQGQDIKNAVANVNLDVPGYGDSVVARTTPEMAMTLRNLTKDLDLESVFTVMDMPTSSTDQWSFVMAGVPTVDFGFVKDGPYQKIYHTNYDTPANVSYFLFAHVSRVLSALVKMLGSAEILPFDLLSTGERLENEIAWGRTRLKRVVDVSEALKYSRRFRVLAREFGRLKRNAVDGIDVEMMNRLQLETCSLLNKSMIGTGGRANKEVAHVILEHFDALLRLKTGLDALERRDIKKAVATLSFIRTLDWGLNVNPNVYDRTFDLMVNHSRYRGIYVNILREILSLKEKNKSESSETSSEVSSIRKKYQLTRVAVREDILSLEAAIKDCCENMVRACMVLRSR